MERWYQSVIMGLSSVERVGTAPSECPAISEENRDKLVRLDPRSGWPAGRRTTLAENATCREAAYLNIAFERSAVPSGSWGGLCLSMGVERNRSAVKGGESSRLEVKDPVSASVPYL